MNPRSVGTGARLTLLTLTGHLVDPVNRWDESLAEDVHRNRSARATTAARIVSALGSPWTAYPVAAVAGIAAAQRRGTSPLTGAIHPTAILASGAFTRWLLCNILQRHRPPEAGWLTDANGYSFPSKHTTLATLAFGVAIGSLPCDRRGHAVVPVVSLCGLVGASRVYLGVHWPSDVVAGWCFAGLWLAATSHLPARRPPLGDHGSAIMRKWLATRRRAQPLLHDQRRSGGPVRYC